MKKLLVIVLAIMMLVGCSKPNNEPSKQSVLIGYKSKITYEKNNYYNNAGTTNEYYDENSVLRWRIADLNAGTEVYYQHYSDLEDNKLLDEYCRELLKDCSYPINIYEFLDNELLSEITYVDENNFEKTVYTYDNNLCVRIEKYDRNNEIITTQELEYDNNGNLVKETHYYKNGVVSLIRELSYDEDGDLCLIGEAKGENQQMTYRKVDSYHVEITCDEEGNATEIIETDKKTGKITSKVEITYDNMDHYQVTTQVREYYDEYGTNVNTDITSKTLNEDGVVIKEVMEHQLVFNTVDGQDSDSFTRIIEYDDYGKIISQTYQDSYGHDVAYTVEYEEIIVER